MHKGEELDVVEEGVRFNKQASPLLTFRSSSTLEKCYCSPWPLTMFLLEDKKGILSVIPLATDPFFKIKI